MAYSSPGGKFLLMPLVAARLACAGHVQSIGAFFLINEDARSFLAAALGKGVIRLSPEFNTSDIFHSRQIGRPGDRS